MSEPRRVFIAGIGYTYLRDFSVGPVLVPEFLPAFLRAEPKEAEAAEPSPFPEWDRFIHERLQAEFLCLFLGHDQDGGGADADLAGVAGGDAAALGHERGLQGFERFILVRVDGDR